jgi:hypothetical protein
MTECILVDTRKVLALCPKKLMGGALGEAARSLFRSLYVHRHVSRSGRSLPGQNKELR